jgi:hypothetical protein
VVDEDAAAHARWIFARFIEIGSCTVLAREVGARGLGTPRGSQIDKKYLYRMQSFVDGSVFARVFLTDVDRCGLRSFVRPVGAVLVTAGLDEVRVPGPNQTRCSVSASLLVAMKRHPFPPVARPFRL